jgi:hypothetical protein
LNISLKSTKNNRLEIFNHLGQIVWSQTNLSEKVAIDVQNWPSGVYIAKLGNGETQKFMKQ